MPAPFHTPSELGDLVRKRRRQLGMTQADVANVSRTGLRLVGEVESGKPTAQLDGVLRIVAALGILLEARTR
jgi:HTH-type transcriptional regulator/antitoxin HipB